ncbi:MAG: DMT family transporter [Rhodobacteraceae bacterium]|nr:DMT family transporter [Paracoccaceae bacterium]
MDNLRGIALMVASMLGFALEDMFIKSSAHSLPPGQVLVIIGTAGTVIFWAYARLRGERFFVREMAHPLMLMRIAGEVIGDACFIFALTVLPLAMVSAVLQAMPLAVTLGAAVFLAAPVGWRRWAAILIGFVGVLVVIRPGTDGFSAVAILPVIAVLALAARDLCTRIAPVHVSSIVLSGWGFSGAALAGVVLLPFGTTPTWPGTGASLAMAGAVLCGVLAYYALTAAMRVGDVATVTPFRYARLIFAILIGIVVFGEIPDRWTLVGGAIIIGSGLYTFARERRLARQTPPLQT